MMKKYKVKVEEKTYMVEIQDLKSKPILAVVDGVTFEIWSEEVECMPEVKAAQAKTTTQAAAPPMISQAATPVSGSGLTSNTIKAPIPGVVIAIKVHPGDVVETGQEICVIEAMKMRNPIRSSRSGTIASVPVTVGQSVSHGELLVEFAD